LLRERLGHDDDPSTAKTEVITDQESTEPGAVPGDVVGLPSGLFRYPGSNRVFASIASKPGSAKTLARPMGTRADDILDPEGRSLLDTRRSAFNPQCVELTVMRQHPDDDPTVWAAAAHAQRRLADTYGDTLLLPWPLHLAKKATEYAIPDLAEETFSDETDDPEGAA
ncbi:RNaseH domain-containing protein, partial [Nocardia gipuzkoensis]|uniref:RNaseH domain-containing protein n=1 Tax=Nocardia gipuzkoensis TaxID=2749991 RepID=UPI00237D6763